MKFFYASGSIVFAIKPLSSMFKKHGENVSCYPVCLLMLHCALSRRTVNGKMQLPDDRVWLLHELAKGALH